MLLYRKKKDKNEDFDWIERMFGSAKGAKPFRREHRDRTF